MTKRKDMSKPANNTGLSYGLKKDVPAIKALQDVAEELGMEVKDALRWMCVNMKAEAMSKAKKIKALLKAS